MKKVLLLLAALTGAPLVFAVEVQTIEIEVVLDQNGWANFTENYTMSFSSPFEFDEFKEKAKKNTVSLSGWEADFDFFYPHFVRGTTNKLGNSRITFDDQTDLLTLQYTLDKRFAELSSESQRASFFTIDDRQFAGFVEGGTIVVPENTIIKIFFPPSSEIDSGSVLPPNSEASANQLTLMGIQTNSMKILYRVVKPIAPRSNDFLQGLAGTYVVLIPLLALLALGAYLKRNEIEKKIESFLVEHSEIKARGAEEELDFDLD